MDAASVTAGVPRHVVPHLAQRAGPDSCCASSLWLCLCLRLQEVLDHLVELMMDPFGNYLIQKLLDRCSEEQRLQVGGGGGAAGRREGFGEGCCYSHAAFPCCHRQPNCSSTCFTD